MSGVFEDSEQYREALQSWAQDNPDVQALFETTDRYDVAFHDWLEVET